jgi:ketosteroid isomerase-like protein
MTRMVLFSGLISMIAAVVAAPSATAPVDTASSIIATERAALDRWSKGDPDAFLDLYDADVVYFDPFVERRVNGYAALKAVYEQYRGKIHIDRYEMIDPKVRVSGDMAVLTFNFVSHGSEGERRWNATEIYQRKNGKWRIIHPHWSLTQPKLA